MKTIRLFYLRNCPFCKRAFVYIDELRKQDKYKNIELETVEESEQPDLADKFDYFYVPTFYLDNVKVHEGGIFPDEVKAIFDRALK
ncbi:MAG: glutathione S-transferase N-terminal domain-containing protein [Tannerella sp.]|jgi:glutaredoxin|nr:glutathione S-transferase N-terminal domain-containing protein [Tannerella sp.]